MKVPIVNNSENPLPFYATSGSAGVDLYANNEEAIILAPLERTLVPTGISLELPEGFEAQVRPRSGLAVKHGITVLNAPGTVDSDYRGEIMVPLINLGSTDYTVVKGDRIAQMVIARHETVEWLEAEALGSTNRGAGGFGHTGSN